jgi:ribosome-interacting GTPase 1
MPANLPPQYYELEREFQKEKDLREKLRLAQELLRIMPKHKGTDHLQADMKTKIAKLRRQIEGGQKKHGARQVVTLDHIEKEGAAQVILIGPPNSGKSTLLDTVTAARPMIGDYPYTTREPLAGMMPFETIQIQLIDTPPIAADYMESFVPPLVRQADLAVLIVDVSMPGFEERVEVVFERLLEKRIKLVPAIPTEMEDFRLVYKKTIMAAHKYLDEGGEVGLHGLRECCGEFTVIPSSVLDDDIINGFKKAVFDALGIIRVYTKKIGHEPDFTDPVILPMGGTVADAAEVIHKDFARKLQYARLWGKSRFEGQKVKSSYVLSDKDIVEFHI